VDGAGWVYMEIIMKSKGLDGNVCSAQSMREADEVLP